MGEMVSPSQIDIFFHKYDEGSLPHYYKPSSLRHETIVNDGIRELSAWDFDEVIKDPHSSVLVAFVSANCRACTEFQKTYKQLSSRVQDMQRKRRKHFFNLTLARIDQTANEHSEFVGGTPALRYWPRGYNKRSRDWFELKDVGKIFDFLEERLSEEVEDVPHVADSEKNSCSTGSQSNACKNSELAAT